MWAHYTNNHEGACLELEVTFDHIFKVKYKSKKLFPGISPITFPKHVNKNNIKKVWGTKSIDWSYEKEWRMHVPLNGEGVLNKNSNYFMPFQDVEDNVFMLKRVFVGYRYSQGISNLQDDVKDYPQRVEVIQTRPSFKRFKVVRQKNKEFWNWDGREKGKEDTLPAVRALFG